MCTLFWLVLNVTNLTLSKLRYLLFAMSKLPSLDSIPHPAGLCALTYHLIDNLWLCCCLCVALQTALKWLVLLHLLHVLHYAGYSLFKVPCTTIFVALYNIILILPETIMFLLVSSNRMKFLCSSYIVPAPPSAFSEPHLIWPRLLLCHYWPHWSLLRLLVLLFSLLL